jgi:two-component system response regulator DegU
MYDSITENIIGSTQTLFASLSIKKVLIVEKNQFLQTGLKKFFIDTLNIEATTASDSVSTIEFLKIYKPNLLIFDLNCLREPLANFLKTIKENYPDIKIIIYNENIDKIDIIQAITNGADGYVVKSNCLNKLLIGIATAIGDGFYLDNQTKYLIAENFNYINQHEGFQELTSREWQILAYLVDGKTNFEISQQCLISNNTVKNYISSIIEKIKVKNRIQVATLAVRCGYF